ncbi:unnamed protein product [Amoebophrya sp. A120]|nr:unnamed protein product [Amoebophrya sp. A120]|eukprot:GSA120T00025035001.1
MSVAWLDEPEPLATAWSPSTVCVFPCAEGEGAYLLPPGSGGGKRTLSKSSAEISTRCPSKASSSSSGIGEDQDGSTHVDAGTKRRTTGPSDYGHSRNYYLYTRPGGGPPSTSDGGPSMSGSSILRNPPSPVTDNAKNLLRKRPHQHGPAILPRRGGKNSNSSALSVLKLLLCLNITETLNLGPAGVQAEQQVVLPGQEEALMASMTAAKAKQELPKYGQHQRFRFQFDPLYYTENRDFPYKHPQPFVATHPIGPANADAVTAAGGGDKLALLDGGNTGAMNKATTSRERMIPLVAPFLNETYLVATYSISYCSPEKSVEDWFQQNESPARHNPLRMASVFNAVGLLKDELGSSCIGYDFQAEMCLQGIDLVKTEDVSTHLPVLWVPAPVVANYRVEALLLPTSSGEPTPLEVNFPDVWEATPALNGYSDRPRNRARLFKTMDEEHAKVLLQYMAAAASAPQDQLASSTNAELLQEEAVPGAQQESPPQHQQQLLGEPLDRLEFNIANIDEPAALWTANLTARESWMAMMSESLQYAVQAGIENADAEGTVWAEFGVASGKSTAYIATALKKTYGSRVTLHGFDSFVGIPEKWNNLEGGTFTMEGKVPEIVTNMPNIQVHKGWFNETKTDLDHLTRVAFLHMDMDIYPAAREVLLHFACRLERGTVLVFDELINYDGWILDGEFMALQEVAALVGLVWEPLGFYHEQAVPIMILDNHRYGC